MNIVLLMPIYNDWQSAAHLIRACDQALSGAGRRARVLVVDDGSDEARGDELDHFHPTAISQVEILHLRCNLGHQRAIAIGLSHVEAAVPCDAVVVLDGDGEDRPEDIDRLLTTLEAGVTPRVVFAERTKRSEGPAFAIAYWLYRGVHRILTGHRVRVGNFAAVPSAILVRLVAVSALWNHFAAAVFQARIPYTTVPTTRGTRYGGRSHMNSVALVTHGLSAMSVFGDRIGVRSLVATLAIMLALMLATIAALSWRLWLGVPLPSWVPYGALLIVLAVQGASIVLSFVFIVLAGRASPGFVPLRDYGHYVLRVVAVPLRLPDGSTDVRRD
jgi:hypothetical protein